MLKFKQSWSEDMDKMVQFVVKVYDGQFTLDQYWDGVDARKFLSTTSDVINAIINETVEAAGVVLNQEKKKTQTLRRRANVQ
ncbi:phage tail assembly chaperone G [Pseudomonas aeruginosa]